MTNIESLLSDASRLPLADRLQLIEALWDTVPEEALPPLSVQWLEEIQKRSAEFDRGSVKSIPWEEVKSAALRRLPSKND